MTQTIPKNPVIVLPNSYESFSSAIYWAFSDIEWAFSDNCHHYAFVWSEKRKTLHEKSMRKGDVWGRLNVAKVLYSCSKTHCSKYERIYEDRPPKVIESSPHY